MQARTIMGQSLERRKMIGEIGYSLDLALWLPDGTCESEYRASLTADEYNEIFRRFVLNQKGGPDDLVHQALVAQAARIRQLEQQVRKLGGNPNEK